MSDITVIIPTIPPRVALLERALASVEAQTLKPADIIVTTDISRQGAAANRDAALGTVKTEWTAFLDDDDYYLPEHLETLVSVNLDDWDVVYTAPLVIDASGNTIPLMREWGNFGNEFDAEYLRKQSYLGMWSMVRTELAQSVGGFTQPNKSQYDDWDFFLAMLDAGARFKHIPVQTYVWTHVPNAGNTGLGNTSGKSDRWK